SDCWGSCVLCEPAVRNYKSNERLSRIRLLILFVLFLVLIVIISGGLATLLGHTARPRPLGWVFFIAGSVIAAVTVDHWARVLPGIFGVATLNGIIILIGEHALNQPSIPVPRVIGALLTIVMAGASVITANSSDLELTNAERGAYLGILCCFVAMLTCTMIGLQHWEVAVSIGFGACLAVLSGRRFFYANKHRART
ncbi:MAG: hypothetical protein ACR2JB_07360, partial [Bryobacteraceae bacterium]